MRRVVVTGLGTLSPLGLGTAHNWAALTAGQSGIRTIRGFDAADLPARIGGEIPLKSETEDGPAHLDIAKFIEHKEQKKMDIALPLAASAVRPEDLSNRDIINLDPQGVLHVGDRPLSDEQMRDHLCARFRASPPLKIYLRADRETPGKRIREFMKLAGEAGAVSVIFGTRPP